MNLFDETASLKIAIFSAGYHTALLTLHFNFYLLYHTYYYICIGMLPLVTTHIIKHVSKWAP